MYYKKRRPACKQHVSFQVVNLMYCSDQWSQFIVPTKCTLLCTSEFEDGALAMKHVGAIYVTLNLNSSVYLAEQ
jgi:hypothetical protein